MENIKKRVYCEAKMMINYKKTLREIAKITNVSKSTVHNDLNKKLPKINYNLYNKIRVILNFHKEIRHINGGNATKLKYELIKKVNK